VTRKNQGVKLHEGNKQNNDTFSNFTHQNNSLWWCYFVICFIL